MLLWKKEKEDLKLKTLVKTKIPLKFKIFHFFHRLKIQFLKFRRIPRNYSDGIKFLGMSAEKFREIMCEISEGIPRKFRWNFVKIKMEFSEKYGIINVCSIMIMSDFFTAKFFQNSVVRNCVISTEFRFRWVLNSELCFPRNSEPRNSAYTRFRGTKFRRNYTEFLDKLRRNCEKLSLCTYMCMYRSHSRNKQSSTRTQYHQRIPLKVGSHCYSALVQPYL